MRRLARAQVPILDAARSSQRLQQNVSDGVPYAARSVIAWFLLQILAVKRIDEDTNVLKLQEIIRAFLRRHSEAVSSVGNHVVMQAWRFDGVYQDAARLHPLDRGESDHLVE